MKRVKTGYITDIKVAIGTWEAPPTIGGPAHYIEELVKRLSDHVEVTLVIPDHASIPEKSGLTIKKIGSIDIPVIRVCMFAARATFLVKKLGVDIIHDNGVLGFSDFSPFIETWHHSNMYDRPYLSFSAYYLSLYRELLTLKGIKNADSIIAISSNAKKELIHTHSIPESKIFTVPHGVDTNFFKPETNKNPKIVDVVYMLYVGGLFPRKNLASLIQALKILRNCRKKVKLLIVGEGPERKYLQELVCQLKLNETVEFFGSLPPQRLLEIYNIADYVVLPSYKEGFGMTILEALACEKPVVMTPSGISEIIEENNLGVVARGFSPVALAKAIELVISKSSKFRNLRSFVKENFSWEITAQKTIEVYQQTLNQLLIY